MHRCHVASIAVLVALLGVQGFAGPSRDLPVISTLVGAGPSDPLRTIQGDGLGPYRNTAVRTSGVQSIVQDAGAWELDTYYFSSDRRLYFDLRNLVPGSGSVDAPMAIVVAPGRLITKCDATGNLLEMNPVLPLFNCALHGRFAYNGRTYLVRMDAASFPGTRNVKVSCTGTDPLNSSRCHNWRIDTCTAQDTTGICTQWGFEGEQPTVDLTANVMTLLEEKTGKGKVTTTRVGDYYMQFEAYVSRQ